MSTDLVKATTDLVKSADHATSGSATAAAAKPKGVGPHNYVEPTYEGSAFGAAEHGHPSDLQYVYVAIGLAVLTGLEIFVSELSQNGATRALLIAMGGVKFAIVAAFFMHLKFDNRVLRIFLIGGIALAIPLYIVVLAAMGNLF